MYKIEKKDYGYKLIFAGFIEAEEMKEWVNESKKILETSPKEFKVFVDMRTLLTLDKQAQKFMEEGQELYKKKGMLRSVVIVDRNLTLLQFKRIAKETKIHTGERYIEALSTDDWEKRGLDWIIDGIEPEQE